MWILISLVLLFGCSSSQPVVPTTTTPYDYRWDDLSARECLNQGGSPGWDSSVNKPVCER